VSQVNSEPGKNQGSANTAVSAATTESGVTDAKAKAAAKSVTYNQSEPGKTINPVRS
jgi:hypothetical protein